MPDQTLYQADIHRPLPNSEGASTVQLVRDFSDGDVLTFWFVEIGGRFLAAAGNPVTVSGAEIDGIARPLVIDTTRRSVQSGHIMVRRVAANQIAVWKEGNFNVPLGLARISGRPLLGALLDEVRFAVTTAQNFVATGLVGWQHFTTLVLQAGQQSRIATGTLRYGAVPNATNTPAGRYAALAGNTTALDEATATLTTLAAISDANVAATSRLWLFFPESRLEFLTWDGHQVSDAGLPGFSRQADYTTGGVTYAVYAADAAGVGHAAVPLTFQGRDTGGRRGGIGFLDVKQLLAVTPAAAGTAVGDANSVFVGAFVRRSATQGSPVYAGRTAAGELLLTTEHAPTGFYPLSVLGR